LKNTTVRPFLGVTGCKQVRTDAGANPLLHRSLSVRHAPTSPRVIARNEAISKLYRSMEAYD
jgi:hypothetical protein